jgi:membrane protease YdiL (CAAX protease family)
MEAAPGKVAVVLRIVVFAFLALAGLGIIAPLLSALGYFLGAVVSTFAAAVIANALALRIWERAHLPALGLFWTAASWRHFVIGFGGGAGAAALVLGVPLLAGGAEFTASGEDPTWSAFLFVTVVLLLGAVSEEVLFRGYAFQVMVPAFGQWATVLPMGVLFGVAHSSNEAVSNLALANTVAWGVLLGYAVLRSGDLWLAIGLHFGWNWTLPVFGVNISGFKIRVTSYTLRWKIGELWSGGDYGPEGGLFCTVVLGALIAFLWWAPIVKQRLPLVERGKEPS